MPEPAPACSAWTLPPAESSGANSALKDQDATVGVTYANGVLYCAEQAGSVTSLVAADATNGRVLWRSPQVTPAFHSPRSW